MLENDSSLFKVDIENYKGPLDVLLDLAKASKEIIKGFQTVSTIEFLPATTKIN